MSESSGQHRNVILGTGWFTLITEEWWTIVTARHVIEEAERLSGETAVWVNHAEGNYRMDYPCSQWLFHPTDATADVAVLSEPVDPQPLDHGAVMSEGFATESLLQDPDLDIGIGDELYFPGLFAPHSGRDRNLPIVRQGTIAGMPLERVSTRRAGSEVLVDAYLVEVRSVGGLSGSPVWLHFDMWRFIPGRPDGPPPPMHPDVLLGIIHGHYDVPADLAHAMGVESVNMGICIVTPIKYVAEALEQPKMLETRAALKSVASDVDAMAATEAIAEESTLWPGSSP